MEKDRIERIKLENISKEFRIGFKKEQGALARLLSSVSGKEPRKIIYALKDVSFTAYSGEIIGMIGENGSGKSTLLRIISGIYKQTSGSLKTNGKIVSLINLYIGMHQRLTMKDNIFMCCSLFGLGKKQAREKYASIVEFSGLMNFVNTKLYQFSNGMLQRLAFSIAINCNPEILLLDEVFEVGDEEFKKKSSNEIIKLAKNGATVILVSHELEIIERYCSRVLWIDTGKIVAEGNPKKMIRDYTRRKVQKEK